MGTTVVACLFHDNRMSIAHVGDSRLYRLRDNRFEQMTLDHSLLQELVDRGFEVELSLDGIDGLDKARSLRTLPGPTASPFDRKMLDERCWAAGMGQSIELGAGPGCGGVECG